MTHPEAVREALTAYRETLLLASIAYRNGDQQRFDELCSLAVRLETVILNNVSMLDRAFQWLMTNLSREG
jgi:hypothetical protein